MPPIVLADILTDILAWDSPAPHPPSFLFEWSMDAAQHNLRVLQEHNCNLREAIWAQPFSSITPGSEFRPVSVLERLCGNHPLWPCVRWYLTAGASWPMEPISEEDRLHDLRHIIRRGNHKSAIVDEARVVQILQDEVQNMW